MRSRMCALGVTLCVAVILIGCGKKVNLRESDRVEDIVPPATAGSLDSLVGTRWHFKSLGTVVEFSSPPSARLVNPDNLQQGGPAYWSYRDNGIVSISAMGTTFAGTWDGEVVILSGERLTRMGGDSRTG